ncbi:antitoxin [Lentzea pudingi]|uniref:Antitoxin n=1 Tax=Lentzea pudingi TaxID=1789439 RepID=A0ABQ2INU2_9PSEU|nr:type II toxin-antitoxin system prevent-host-death family antitoxin [Lentzea pudingi]GGN17426.1 antitoxin [Lentzea pudingi]
METRVPLATARNQLSELVARVEKTHERVTLTKHGADTVVLIAKAELEGLEQTIEILSAEDDSRGQVLKAIRQAQEDVAQGRIADMDELIESLKRRTGE